MTATQYIAAIRPLLLWEFGTTDPELIADILRDRRQATTPAEAAVEKPSRSPLPENPNPPQSND